MNLNYRKFIIILYTPEIQKYIQTEVILILTMDLEVVLTGLVFLVIDNKSFYFDSFGGQPDKLLLKQLPKPTINHKYKIQDINSQFMWFILFVFFLSN